MDGWRGALHFYDHRPSVNASPPPPRIVERWWLIELEPQHTADANHFSSLRVREPARYWATRANLLVQISSAISSLIAPALFPFLRSKYAIPDDMPETPTELVI